MIGKVRELIKKHNLIELNDKIVLGLSGGADSICLLYLLISLQKEYNLIITAVHINHMLRENDSDKDQKFVEDTCNMLNINLHVYKHNVSSNADKNKITIEQAGRNLRYNSFYETLKKTNSNKIATAHNKNDQAETLLMRFFRGTGTKGLAGIGIKNDVIVRPLLETDREDIELYCENNSFKYVNDKTNDMSIYTRNITRLELIPFIKKNYNKNIINTLSNQSKLYEEENDFLDKEAKKLMKEMVILKDKKVYINIEEVNKINDVLKRRIFRNVLLKYNKTLKDISLINIEDMLGLLNNQTGKQIHLPGHIRVSNEYNHLVIYKEDAVLDKKFSYDLEFEKLTYIKEINKYILVSKAFEEFKMAKKLKLVYTKIYSYDTINNVIQLRSRQAGDVIKLNIGTKKIKDVFIDDKVPQNERNMIPLLANGSNIIAIFDGKDRESLPYTIETEKVFVVKIWEDTDEGKN